MSLKGAVEAALLAAGGPIPLVDLARVVGSPPDEVEGALKGLRQEFREREGGIEIAYLAGGSWVLQVHKQYTGLVQRLVPLDMEPSLLKTLSVIALLQPVCQAKIVERRGQGAYGQVKQLVKRGLITKEPEGNSYLLKTTMEFARRFRLKDDPEAIRQAMFDRAKALDGSEVGEAAAALVERIVGEAREATEAAAAASPDAAPAGAGVPPAAAPAPESASALAEAGPSSEASSAEPAVPSAVVEAAPLATSPDADAQGEGSQAREEAPEEPVTGRGPGTITRLSDHKSARHRILEERDRLDCAADEAVAGESGS